MRKYFNITYSPNKYDWDCYYDCPDRDTCRKELTIYIGTKLTIRFQWKIKYEKE